MRVVIAPDSFKECLSAPEVARALEAGWRLARSGDDVVCVPMADGGEGTVDALVAATQGRLHTVRVAGPLGDAVDAAYGVLGDGQTAVMEMAEASGLALVPVSRRDATRASTRGTGELMARALDSGASRLIVGVGGSATNDGGAGMAQALGFSLLDGRGESLPPGGLALARLARIDARGRHPRLGACEIEVACDVDNPLCGPRGASRVYGPQKGATPEQVAALDAALAHFAAVVKRDLGADVAEAPGAGAAGGLGAGLMAFTGARLRPGAALIAETCGLEKRLRGADLVITGEGRMDAQTAHGKTPLGVARLAAKHGVPVVGVCGVLGDGHQTLHRLGIERIWPISEPAEPLAGAMADARNRLTRAAAQVAAWWTREYTKSSEP